MAFTYDLSTSRGEVRFGIGDTNEAHALFTDAEIDHFLSVGGTTNQAIVEGLRHLLVYHAHRLDPARAAAIKSAIEDRGGMPTVQITYPAALPMDAGYDESDP